MQSAALGINSADYEYIEQEHQDYHLDSSLEHKARQSRHAIAKELVAMNDSNRLHQQNIAVPLEAALGRPLSQREVRLENLTLATEFTTDASADSSKPLLPTIANELKIKS
ncbi:Atp-binding protein [Globisporangium polare]